MNKRSKITSIVAHIDHGKTTLMDSLIAFDGHISKSLAGDIRYLDNREDEQTRQITLKLSPVELSNGHVFIDTPGHVDFESLIFCSSILADNHIIIIDVNEGITPRTYSLVKYINKERAVLVLNKIDGCSDFDTILTSVYQINGLVGSEVFLWEKGNIVLCCASLCCGVSYHNFKFGKKNSIKSAFAAFNFLNKKYDNDDVSEIMIKYKIKYKTRKNIFSAVMPLHTAIFSAIDQLYDEGFNNNIDNCIENNNINDGCIENNNINGGCIKNNNSNNNCIENNNSNNNCIENNTKHVFIDTPFYKISATKKLTMAGITVYGIFKDKNIYTQENILFVTKLITGTISVGDVVISTSNTESKKSVIEKIYFFRVGKFTEVESVTGPALVAIKGDLLKNSVITFENIDFNLNNFLTPFFMSKILLTDMKQMDDIKATIRAISYTEQCLKVKKNKFSELEVRCSGEIQFEKICTDLMNANFMFIFKEASRQFKEFVGAERQIEYNMDGTNFVIKMGSSCNYEDEVINQLENNLDESFISIECKNNNLICIRGNQISHIIESVVKVFLDDGPLIRENIVDSYIYVYFKTECDTKIYNILKNELSLLYLNGNPGICPLLYKLKISLEKVYLGPVYQTLQKYSCIIGEEFYDEDTGFYILDCKIAQYMLSNAIKDIRSKSKGMAYVTVEEAGYSMDADFRHMIQSIRSEKGLRVERSIAEEIECLQISRKQYK